MKKHGRRTFLAMLGLLPMAPLLGTTGQSPPAPDHPATVVTVTGRGSGYATAPAVSIMGGGGSGSSASVAYLQEEWSTGVGVAYESPLSVYLSPGVYAVDDLKLPHGVRLIGHGGAA